jgi:hypothetical protein
MAETKTVSVDKKQLEHAQSLWHNFGVASKWGIIAVVVSLIGLALLTL